jgi:hypothetical protein
VYFFTRRTRAVSFLIGGATRPNAGVSFTNQSLLTMSKRNNSEALRIPFGARNFNARSSAGVQFTVLSTVFAGRF